MGISQVGVDLPPAREAAGWLIETARQALAAGDRIDLDTVLALRALAPRDPVVAMAIDRLDSRDEDVAANSLAAKARHTSAALMIALESNDQEFGRQVVSDFETDLLSVFRPGRSLGAFEDDVAMASLLLDVWEAGRQLPHQMMAEELMRIALREYWRDRHQLVFAVRSEAARTLARLYRATDKPEYYDYAVALLRDFADTYQQHGLAAARYVLALQVIS